MVLSPVSILHDVRPAQDHSMPKMGASFQPLPPRSVYTQVVGVSWYAKNAFCPAHILKRPWPERVELAGISIASAGETQPSASCKREVLGEGTKRRRRDVRGMRDSPPRCLTYDSLGIPVSTSPATLNFPYHDLSHYALFPGRLLILPNEFKLEYMNGCRLLMNL